MSPPSHKALHREILRVILVAGILWLSVSVAGGPEPPQAPALGSSEDWTVDPLPEVLQFERLTVDDGLSQGSVFCILQDTLGFMWFGTQDGLNRYDGYEFKVYRHSLGDPNSLNQSTIAFLFEDRAGTLWVGTEVGINRYDRSADAFDRFDWNDHFQDGFATVRRIYEDKEGNLWVLAGGEAFLFDRRREAFDHVPSGESDSYGVHYPHLLLEDPSGTIWFGVHTSLYRYHPDREAFVHVGLPVEGKDLYLMDMRVEGERVVVYTNHGPCALDEKTQQFRRAEDRGILPVERAFEWGVRTGILGSRGRAWMGTASQGLYVVDPRNGESVNFRHDPNDPHSLSHNALSALYEDRSGVIWIGTENRGISRCDNLKGKFTRYGRNANDPNSLSDNQVWTLMEDARGDLWIGTARGLDCFDRNNRTFRHFVHDPEDEASLQQGYVHALCERADGKIWVGTMGGGLSLLDPVRETFHRFSPDCENPKSLAATAIFCLLEDDAGTLWIGTGRSLWRYHDEDGTFENFKHDPEDPTTPSHSTIKTLYQDLQGRIWLGTPRGVDRLDPITGEVARIHQQPQGRNALSTGSVQCIRGDEAGRLWIGTFGGGLYRFDLKYSEMRRYTQADGLPNDVVYGVLGDDQGRLWLSTNEGLSRFDPINETFRNYDVRDGLQSNEFNSGAFYESASGEMFFGGVNGFNVHRPGEIVDNGQPPAVILTDFELMESESVRDRFELDTSIAETEEIVLTHDQNQFAFRYVGLHFSAPDKNRYAYMMVGLDKDWIDVGSRRVAIYTNMPHGEYLFRVKASNCDGVWNEEGASVRVVILPPWWKTWWAFCLYVLLAVLLLYGVIRAVKAREREKARLIESELRARAAELQSRVAEAQAKVLQSENDQKTRELEEARKLQLSMLPKKLPEVPGLDIAVYMNTANTVGGDYYDFCIDDDGHLHVAVGDATGHSTKAGIMVAIMKGLFSAWKGRTGLGSFLENCDRILTEMELESMYMALLLLKFRGLDVEAVGAAMPAMLIHRRETGEVEEVVIRGMFLGFNLMLPYSRKTFSLNPGDTLLIMSDGLQDLFNEQDETFDYERVKECFAKAGGSAPREVISALFQAAEDWRDGAQQNDDITFVVIRAASSS